ncbi:hypothetical protein CK203_117209 [Vitis vinifera]|uniref:Uncharacterized protein n=1 Tax=Vitis vinifera TaxID=29760 RepID=A0A438D801_VITVI|nr:hypothetical protein CK203_117209 [Vitis vinifera]
MEEQQERKNVGEIELEGGQPSRNSGQIGLDIEEHRIDVVINPRVKIWIGSIEKAEARTQSQWPRIPKVPHILRGPRISRNWEMIKPLCARTFLADSNQDIEVLYKNIRSNIKAVRNCYDWSSTNEYDDEKLAWMMLLDGSFLLHLIHCGMSGNESELGGLNVKDYFIVLAHEDLFLLENQLPFGVLKLIFEGAKFKDDSPMKKMIKIFVTNAVRYKKSSKKKVGSQPEQEQQLEKKEKSSPSQGGDGWFCCPWKKGKQQGFWQPFGHIKVLKAAGIYSKLSRTSSLTNISFNSYFFYGHLKLPPIIIDSATKARFLNMVAYEMCAEVPDDYGVASYICFLDNLIDHADDVKELRSKHILYNLLGR